MVIEVIAISLLLSPFWIMLMKKYFILEKTRTKQTQEDNHLQQYFMTTHYFNYSCK